MTPDSDSTPSADDEQGGSAQEGSMQERTAQQEDLERKGTTCWQVAQSVGAAMLGVQSSKNRQRDFQSGKPLHFIVGGVLGTLVFILCIWLLVQYLLATQ